MAKKSLRRGVFITFEGVEGCGKSTHSRLVYRYLKNKGYPCIYTKEPGGTKIGDKIRGVLLDAKNKKLSDITELFLFEASRSQVVNEVIRSSLKHKRIVICDRFYDATMAYQGYGASLDKSAIKVLNNLATGGIKPDLTVVLDIDVKKGLKMATRRRKRDRMEEKSFSFHNRVRRGYKAIARSQPHRVKIVVTKKEVSQTQALVRKEVLGVVQRYKITG